MKELSPIVRKIIAVYLGLLLLALLFVPGGGNFSNGGGFTYSGYVFLPMVFFPGNYYVHYWTLTLEIVVLTVAAAFALAVESVLSHRRKGKEEEE
jgi:hypothetical protein